MTKMCYLKVSDLINAKTTSSYHQAYSDKKGLLYPEDADED